MKVQVFVGLVCLLLVCVTPTALGTGSGPPEQLADDGQSIDASYTVDRLPGRTGRVAVTAVIALPRRVSGLSVATPPGATVHRTKGVEPDGERWRLVGDAETARLRYTVPIGLTTTFGQRTADTGEWALIARQEVALRVRWRWRVGPRPAWNESLAVAPGQDGVAGETAAYLGPHETVTRTVDGDRLTLVVPEHADMRPSPAAVLDSIAHAKRASAAGRDHDHLRVFVAPNRLASGGYTPTNGGPDTIVNAGEPVRSPVNVWVHEYRHTRQAYETTPEMAWLEEGSADYQAAVRSYQHGTIDRARFRARVTTDRHGDADLTRPETWDGPNAQYDKGTRVVAAIDARVRVATGGEATIETVLARFSRRDEPVTLAAFARTVSTVAGTDLYAFVQRAVTGPAPAVPTVAVAEGDALKTGSADTDDRARNTAPLGRASETTQQSDTVADRRGRSIGARSGQWSALGSLTVVAALLGYRRRGSR